MMTKILVSDWVKGKSTNDERFRGYVESIDEAHHIAFVRVVESDNRKAIGKIVKSHLHQTEKLPDQVFTSKEQIKSLIDVALMIGDRSWFRELTDMVNDTPDVTDNEWRGKGYSFNRLSGYFSESSSV